MNINIDKFELLYWLEGCAHGSHLRQGIWQRCIDEFYDKLSPDERLWLYTYAKRDITECYLREDRYGRNDFFKFLACYNPANRYTVTAEGDIDGEHVKQVVNAFRYGDDYWISYRRTVAKELVVEGPSQLVDWISYRRTVAKEYIKSVERDKVSPCAAKYCMWHKTCARYSDGPNVTGYYTPFAHTKCDWYINKATDHGADLSHFEI